MLTHPLSPSAKRCRIAGYLVKGFWLLVCVCMLSAGASAQSSPLAFNQVTTSFANALPLAGANGIASAGQCGTFGDWNGDGYQDYASFGSVRSDGTTLLRGYLGTAAGVPGSIGSTVLSGFACGASQPVAADVNGDGRADLLVLEPASILVLLSQGNGTFAAPLSVAYTPVITSFAGGQAASLMGNALLADLDGDGFRDLVVSDNAGQVLWYPGHGDGTFAAPVTLVAAASATPASPADQTFFGSMVSGDLNGDGIADLAVCAAGKGSVCRGYVFLGSAAGPVAHTQGAPPPLDEPIALADLNGDGLADLLLLPTSGASTGLLFAAGDGAGGFRTPVNAGAAGQQLQVAGYGFLLDLNGDGRPDLVFQQAGLTGLAWAPGNGDGAFGAAALIAAPANGAVLEQAAYLAPGLPVVVDTQGTLYEPAATANAYVLGAWFLDFGAVTAGSISSAQTVTVTGSGSGFAVSSVQAAVPVQETDTCGATPANCAVSVAIAPSSAAPYVGAVTVATTAGAVKIPVFANEAAAAAVSALRFSPATVTFAAQPLLTPSAPTTLTLTNTGTSAVTLSGFAVTGNQAGDFTDSSACGSQIAAAANCTVSVVFTPQVVGPAAATLTVTDSTGLTQSAALTGAGVYAPSFAASPSQLAFGQVRVGDTSAAQTITLTNTSRQTATLSSEAVAVSGGGSATVFPVSPGGCAAAVSPGASCTLSVAFAPDQAQTVNATLALVDQNGKATDVGLTGTGYLSNPDAVVSPASLVFAPEVLYTTSAPQTVTITNTGMQALSVSFVGIAGSFTQTGSCATVAAGTSCTIAVTYTASILGPVTGSLSVTDNSGLGVQTVTLSGTGIPAPAPQIEVGPATVTFPDTLANSLSQAQTVTVTNTGTAVSNIGSVTVTGPFTVTSACGLTLAPNTSCAVGVTFAPTAEGPASGVLTIVDDAPGSPQTIPLGGNGTTVSVAAGSGSTTTQTVTAGSPATYTLTVQPQNGFTGTLLVSCTGAPSGYQCTPSVSSVVLNGQSPANVTFTVQSTTVQTTAQTTAQSAQKRIRAGWERLPCNRGGSLPGDPGGSLPALAVPLLRWMGARRRRRARGRREQLRIAKRWSATASTAACALGLMLLLSGCSGSQTAAVAPPVTAPVVPVTPVTPPTVTQQTYTLQATFTSQASGATISQPLTLVVNTPAQ